MVISGDTTKSESVIVNARGADLLLHEALAASMTGRAVERAAALGIARIAKLAGDVADYHSTPVEAAEVAHEDVQRLRQIDVLVLLLLASAETGFAIPIEGGALLRITQHVVRFGDRLELLLGLFVPVVLVGMILQRQLAEGVFDGLGLKSCVGTRCVRRVKLGG